MHLTACTKLFKELSNTDNPVTFDNKVLFTIEQNGFLTPFKSAIFYEGLLAKQIYFSIN